MVTSIFFFPTMFSKGFFFRVVNSRGCVVESYQTSVIHILCLCPMGDKFSLWSESKSSWQTMEQARSIYFSSTLSQMINFRLFQTERVCRWQFQINTRFVLIVKGLVSQTTYFKSKQQVTWFHLQSNPLIPFPNDKFLTLLNWKSLQTTISHLIKIAESSLES